MNSADAGNAQTIFEPGAFLRLFRRSSFRRKLGTGELIWSRALAKRGIAWVAFDKLTWKLNLANDTHRWLVYGEYELPTLRRLLERIIRSDSIVIDSGANIGQMVLLILLCGSPAKIHAFEPTAEARIWLEKCIAHNALENVIVSSLALGDQDGAANFMTGDFRFK